MKLMYAPQPTPEVISALAEREIRAVACGHAHTLALDTQQAAYTWGACGFISIITHRDMHAACGGRAP